MAIPATESKKTEATLGNRILRDSCQRKYHDSAGHLYAHLDKKPLLSGISHGTSAGDATKARLYSEIDPVSLNKMLKIAPGVSYERYNIQCMDALLHFSDSCLSNSRAAIEYGFEKYEMHPGLVAINSCLILLTNMLMALQTMRHMGVLLTEDFNAVVKSAAVAGALAYRKAKKRNTIEATTHTPELIAKAVIDDITNEAEQIDAGKIDLEGCSGLIQRGYLEDQCFQLFSNLGIPKGKKEVLLNYWKAMGVHGRARTLLALMDDRIYALKMQRMTTNILLVLTASTITFIASGLALYCAVMAASKAGFALTPQIILVLTAVAVTLIVTMAVLSMIRCALNRNGLASTKANSAAGRASMVYVYDLMWLISAYSGPGVTEEQKERALNLIINHPSDGSIRSVGQDLILQRTKKGISTFVNNLSYASDSTKKYVMDAYETGLMDYCSISRIPPKMSPLGSKVSGTDIDMARSALSFCASMSIIGIGLVKLLTSPIGIASTVAFAIAAACVFVAKVLDITHTALTKAINTRNANEGTKAIMRDLVAQSLSRRKITDNIPDSYAGLTINQPRACAFVASIKQLDRFSELRSGGKIGKKYQWTEKALGFLSEVAITGLTKFDVLYHLRTNPYTGGLEDDKFDIQVASTMIGAAGGGAAAVGLIATMANAGIACGAIVMLLSLMIMINAMIHRNQYFALENGGVDKTIMYLAARTARAAERFIDKKTQDVSHELPISDIDIQRLKDARSLLESLDQLVSADNVLAMIKKTKIYPDDQFALVEKKIRLLTTSYDRAKLAYTQISLDQNGDYISKRSSAVKDLCASLIGLTLASYAMYVFESNMLLALATIVVIASIIALISSIVSLLYASAASKFDVRKAEFVPALGDLDYRFNANIFRELENGTLRGQDNTAPITNTSQLVTAEEYAHMMDDMQDIADNNLANQSQKVDAILLYSSASAMGEKQQAASNA